MLPVTTSIQHSAGVLAREIRQDKEIKGTEIRKKEVKKSLFADDMILYREISKESTKKWLELINKLSKVARYKINVLELVVFLQASHVYPKKTLLQ